MHTFCMHFFYVYAYVRKMILSAYRFQGLRVKPQMIGLNSQEVHFSSALQLCSVCTYLTHDVVHKIIADDCALL